jgi:hypothetical protein
LHRAEKSLDGEKSCATVSASNKPEPEAIMARSNTNTNTNFSDARFHAAINDGATLDEAWEYAEGKVSTCASYEIAHGASIVTDGDTDGTDVVADFTTTLESFAAIGIKIYTLRDEFGFTRRNRECTRCFHELNIGDEIRRLVQVIDGAFTTEHIGRCCFGTYS